MADYNDYEDYDEYKDSSKESGRARSARFKSSNPSLLILGVIFLLVVIIIVEIVAIGGLDKNPSEQGDATDNPIMVGTDSPTDGATEGATEGSATGEPTLAPTSDVTTQTQAPATAAPTKAPSTTPNGDIKAAQILDPSTIDFSFLNGINVEPFADGAPLKSTDSNYSQRLPIEQQVGRVYDWYPGSVERLADGTVKKAWDRYDSTLSLLKKYNGIYRKDESKNEIVLTFDCGYEYGYTSKILDTLKEKNVKAIFFVTAEFTDNSKNHDLLRRMYNEGHLIGNHTTNHPIMPSMSNEEFVKELNHVYSQCKKILGDDFTMAYYRPPQGACNERDLALAQYLGYNTTFWSFAYGDYNTASQPSYESALSTMKSKLHPGAVYLLHAVSSTNAAVLGDFIDYVYAEGFTIARIDQA